MADEKTEEASAAEARPRRAQAGRNIGRLIDQELDGDDFYKSAYGGFGEESEDEEYEEEDSEDDVVDSDFDVDESTWHMEEEGDEQVQEKKKKKQWIKPARPKPHPPADPQTSQQAQIDQSHPPPSTETFIKPPKAKKPRTTFAPDISEPSEQRSLRKSTLVVSEEFRRRMQEEEEMREIQRTRKSNSRKMPQRRLTQQELLEEAQRTERENIASLEAYVRLVAEKKKVKEKVREVQGPFIRFHSTSMPMITELPDPVEIKQEDSQISDVGSTETPSVVENQTSGEQPSSSKSQMYCRNFLIFTDTLNYPSAFFPSTKPRKPRKKFCAVTGLPARYMDPLTSTPYATSQAFRIIRNKYISEGEQKCEKRLLQLSSWLEEKKRKKLESKAY